VRSRGSLLDRPLGATFLDENGSENPILIGSYGIGPARIVWPPALAPDEPEREAADKLRQIKAHPLTVGLASIQPRKRE